MTARRAMVYRYDVRLETIEDVHAFYTLARADTTLDDYDLIRVNGVAITMTSVAHFYPSAIVELLD
jgi:hypothetical protein